MQEERLSGLERGLTLWIFLAMAAGVLLGRLWPGAAEWIDSLRLGSTSIPIAIGLIVMLYPPLARVDYARMGEGFRDRRLLGLSLVLNWLIGPLLMFALAAIFLHQHPAYMTGLILVGIARCIAMVLVWNRLARGSSEYGAGLVALNSLFQVATYGFYAWLFITVLPGWLGLAGQAIHVGVWQVVQSVLLYLGVPFLMAIIGRHLLIGARGRPWYDSRYMPRVAPLALAALLFTIVVMFSLKGEALLSIPLDALRIAVPLVLYFVLMFALSLWLAWRAGADYERGVAIAFTASGNNFELAIAVAIAVFGIHSPEAFATVIGPLVEVPVLIAMVGVARRSRGRWPGAAAPVSVPVRD